MTQPTSEEINSALELLKAKRNKEAIDFSLKLNKKYSTSVPVIKLLSNAYIATSD